MSSSRKAGGKLVWMYEDGETLRGLFTKQACLSGHSLGYLAWLPVLPQVSRYWVQVLWES